MLIEITVLLTLLWLPIMGICLRPAFAVIRAHKGR